MGMVLLRMPGTSREEGSFAWGYFHNIGKAAMVNVTAHFCSPSEWEVMKTIEHGKLIKSCFSVIFVGDRSSSCINKHEFSYWF